MSFPLLSSLKADGILAGMARAVADLRAPAGRRSLFIIGLVASCFVLLWPTTTTLLARWLDSDHRTYTHGFAILGISAYLIWRERQRVAQLDVRGSWFGAVGILALGLMWFIAQRAGLQVVHETLLPAIVFASVWAYGGARLIRVLWVALAYLYFAVPIWDAINAALQWISVFAIRFLLRASAIPAYFDGNTFQLPAGTFEIAGGCSGLHFMIVALAISVLYGEINRDTSATRLRLIVLAAILAMTTNWLRIFIIVVAGHLSDMQHYLVTHEHYSFGWYVFAGTMVLFFAIARRWPVIESTPRPREVASGAKNSRGVALSAACLGAIGLLPLLRPVDATAARSALESLSMPGWLEIPGQGGWTPKFTGSDAEVHRWFGRDGRRIELYAAVYRLQHQGKEIAGYGNTLFDRGLRRRARSPVLAPGWSSVEAVDAEGATWLVWTSYEVGERRFDTLLAAQIAYGAHTLMNTPVSAVAALRTPCDPDCGVAGTALAQFVSELPARKVRP